MRQLILLLLVVGWPAHGQEAAPRGCADDETYSMLDFWLGEWDVFVDDELAGTNVIEKILAGCAVAEHWTGAGGSRGDSLFYVDGQGTWKQVWVTEYARMVGGIKEKTNLPMPGVHEVRFQGRILDDDGSSYLDRTTLTDLGNGSVRQLIEFSRDQGETWSAVFDAEYRPAG